jgi:uncharacterized membrane protein
MTARDDHAEEEGEGTRGDRPAARFDAVLYPSRSLPPRGFLAVMAAVAAASAGMGAGFLAVGAWPVTGFLGLDVLLLYLAFRWNYRAGRTAEFVRLDADGLTVRRVRPDGRARTWRFEPYWVRVEVVADGGPSRRHGGGGGRLTLSSHGRSLTIGAFLTADERLEVARALQAALAAWRVAPA